MSLTRAICIALISALIGQGPPFYSFKDKTDLRSGSYSGYAVLYTESYLARGVDFPVTIEFHNKGSGVDFFNPFFDRAFPLPAQLAIYDSEHRYLGDLLDIQNPARKSLDSRAWTFVPDGAFTGVELWLTGGNLRKNTSGAEFQLLPVGTYYLQVIFYKTFISQKPNPGSAMPQLSDRAELFRSNYLKVILGEV